MPTKKTFQITLVRVLLLLDLIFCFFHELNCLFPKLSGVHRLRELLDMLVPEAPSQHLSLFGAGVAPENSEIVAWPVMWPELDLVHVQPRLSLVPFDTCAFFAGPPG